jgi:hypothetical protein
MQPPKPEYTLVKDVIGNPNDRKPTKLKIFEVDYDVPYPPKKNCKKCFGRGYIGKDALTNSIYFCKKCYPMIP